MNIFVLDLNPKLAAQYHNDAHCIKMILETAQLLSTAVWYWRGVSDFADFGLYKPSYIKHPCALWAKTSRANFQWLCELGLMLCEEKNFRYGGGHKSESVIHKAQSYNHLLPDLPMTPFAQAMPNEYKNIDPVVAYRNYYRGAKKHLLKYTKREIPEWLNA